MTTDTHDESMPIVLFLAHKPLHQITLIFVIKIFNLYTFL